MMVGFCLKIVDPPYSKYCQAFFSLSGIFTPTSTFEYGLQFATVWPSPVCILQFHILFQSMAAMAQREALP